MKVTKQYCDVCGMETERILNTRVYSTPNTPEYPFGSVKCDGVWEIELCSDCLKTATSKLLEMKPEDKE